MPWLLIRKQTKTIVLSVRSLKRRQIGKRLFRDKTLMEEKGKMRKS